MNICVVCKKEITKDDKELIKQNNSEIFDQVNFLGIESLPENLQLLIYFQVHDDCYEGL